MIKNLCLAAMVVCMSNHIVSQNHQPYNWQNVPIVGGGFVDGIVCHPSEKGLRYARTDMGGAYRWDDVAKRWVPLLDWLSYNDANLMGVESVAIDPSNPDMLYLACGTYTNPRAGNGAILVSKNRGESFARVDVPFKMGGNENGRGNGERMVVDPQNPNMVYLGTRHDGLWRSANSGVTWNRVASFPNVTDSLELKNPNRYWQGGAGIVCVAYDTVNSAKLGVSDIYVAVSLMGRPNLFVSRDGGLTWAEVPGHPQQYRPTHMAVASNGDIFLTYGDNPGPMPMTNGAVWKYNAKTEKWTDITPDRPDSSTRKGFGYAAVALDAQNPQRVLVSSFFRPYQLGGEEIFQSLDGGATWKAAMKTGVKYDYALAPYMKHTGIHWLFDLEIDPFDADHVMFTTGYGGHETYNFSAIDDDKTPIVWQVLANGIEETVALDLLSPPQGPHLYSAIGDYCGAAHYAFDKPVPEGCFENPHFSNTNGIACAELNPSIVVRVGRGADHGAKSANIGYSLDAGRTWSPCASAPAEKSAFGHIAVSAKGEAWIWTPERQKPFLTTDNGTTWHYIENLPVDCRVVADKVDPKKFYALSLFDGELFVSRDMGKSFVKQLLVLPKGLPQKGFRGDERGGQDRLYTVPSKPNQLWLAAYDGLYWSADEGKSFVQLPAVNEIHGFGFGKAAPRAKYPSVFLIGVVDGQRGIFRSDDKATTWVRINDDQHQWGLLLHITGDTNVYGRAYVGTHGRGIVVGDIAK